MTSRNYCGWIPDKVDPRDRKFIARAAPLRPVVERMGLGRVRIEDQGRLGSCTGQATTTALEIVMGYPAEVQLSRLFPYYTARVMEHTADQDAGAQIRDVIKGLIAVGTPPEQAWPYDVARYADEPPAEVYLQAAEVRQDIERAGIVYQRIDDLNGVLHALDDGCPVVFGFMVTPEFEALPADGVVPLPSQGEAFLGGHAVCGVGYEMAAQFVWVQNSWGTRHGIGGYFKLPFGYFEQPGLVNDSWALCKGSQP
jgi:C1A family cysteine protease